MHRSQITSTGLAIRIIAAVVATFAGCIATVGVYRWDMRREVLNKWKLVRLGDTEEAVRSVLGQPFRTYNKSDTLKDYYETGYDHRIRPIDGKVLLYTGADMILYVWLDETGQVQETFHGGS